MAGQPSVGDSDGPFEVTVTVTFEDIPPSPETHEVEAHEVAAAALLAIALADNGNPRLRLDRPHAASFSYPDEDGPDARRKDVGTVTLRILAEYPDLLPVVVGKVPGRIREMTVINVD
jgi:hypothetical protein